MKDIHPLLHDALFHPICRMQEEEDLIFLLKGGERFVPKDILAKGHSLIKTLKQIC